MRYSKIRESKIKFKKKKDKNLESVKQTSPIEKHINKEFEEEEKILKQIIVKRIDQLNSSFKYFNIDITINEKNKISDKSKEQSSLDETDLIGQPDNLNPIDNGKATDKCNTEEVSTERESKKFNSIHYYSDDNSICKKDNSCTRKKYASDNIRIKNDSNIKPKDIIADGCSIRSMNTCKTKFSEGRTPYVSNTNKVAIDSIIRKQSIYMNTNHSLNGPDGSSNDNISEYVNACITFLTPYLFFAIERAIRCTNLNYEHNREIQNNIIININRYLYNANYIKLCNIIIDSTVAMVCIHIMT